MDNRKFRESPAEHGPGRAEHGPDRESPGNEPAPAAADMTEAEARGILVRSLRLLDRINVMADRVLVATPPAVAEAVFINDEPVEVEGLANPKSRPRGRAHPLLVISKIGVQASRLVDRIVRSLFPELMNAPPTKATASSIETLVKGLEGMAREMGLDPNAT